MSRGEEGDETKLIRPRTLLVKGSETMLAKAGSPLNRSRSGRAANTAQASIGLSNAAMSRSKGGDETELKCAGTLLVEKSEAVLMAAGRSLDRSRSGMSGWDGSTG